MGQSDEIDEIIDRLMVGDDNIGTLFSPDLVSQYFPAENKGRNEPGNDLRQTVYEQVRLGVAHKTPAFLFSLSLISIPYFPPMGKK